MKSFGMCLVAAALAVCPGLWIAAAQDASTPAYLNPSLPPEQRAADLVSRMTLAEKVTQVVNQARAIPRLNVPAYNWWSEALHGVLTAGTTEFPEPIGLAATFDAQAIHEMATAIGVEGRIKHVQAERAGHSKIFEGLDFWAPNINIFRDPRWGRGQETYGEDPFLTARMGVAFVTGMQGDDPHYYRAIATPKHYAVHSGPEPTRHTADVTVSKHDEMDTYLPAFRATVTEAKAGSVMCAYNSINGQPACANEFLMQDQLRGKWAFQGYVVSDCDAIINIYGGHHYKPTQAQASAISLQRGMDNECSGGWDQTLTDDHDYKPYLDAVKQGFLKESEIDLAVTRLFTARMKLGMFDPPQMVPYSNIDESLLDGPAHRALARKIANESMVLLKNDGVLPLKTSGIKIAVIGPLANQSNVLLGNYSGTPTHSVSIMEGLRKEFPADAINYVPGTIFLASENPSPRPDGWSQADLTPQPEAIEAAKNADVVIAVVGITRHLEGEEMKVDLPGFKGGDRTSLDLPKPEEALLEAVAATGKPLVVVLTNGSALGVNWANDHANAILDAWYPGEEGGAAVAQTLSGRNNPAGRLPVTFYKDVSQLPPFEDYAMKGRTYRYFEGTPLYPFGYGLSYTTFAYSGLTVPTAPVAAGSPVVVEATVTNTGKIAGDEVAQLYLSFPDVPGRPLKALRGFQRVHLEPGASQKLHFNLQPRDLSMVTEAGEPIVAEGKYAISVGGNQPNVGAPVLTQPLEIKGALNLPE